LTLNRYRRFLDRLAFTLNNRIRTFLSPPEELVSKLDVGGGDVVVDFGCGPGFFTIPLAKAAGKVIGIDVSPRMLERASSYARRNKLTAEFVRSDGTDIRLGHDSADMILLNHVFHEVDDRRNVLSEFLRIMKPYGRLAIVERTRGRSILSGRLGPPIVNEAEVIKELELAGFRFVRTIPHGKDSIIIARKMTST
jgi:ubiquinone/menaquinone biosynthesis C-methylase UbiE